MRDRRASVIPTFGARSLCPSPRHSRASAIISAFGIGVVVIVISLTILDSPLGCLFSGLYHNRGAEFRLLRPRRHIELIAKRDRRQVDRPFDSLAYGTSDVSRGDLRLHAVKDVASVHVRHRWRSARQFKFHLLTECQGLLRWNVACF